MNTVSSAPIAPVKSNRSFVKVLILTIVTLGIYGIIFYSGISTDINRIASPHDGKKTMHYCLVYFLLGPITLGIFRLIWSHKISGRIGRELHRRGLPEKFGSSTYWLWNILGSLILVGSFIYLYKLCQAMNALAQDYNTKG